MEGRRPEGCTADTGVKMLEQLNWGYRSGMEARFDGGQGPDGAVVTYVGGWTEFHSCVW